MKYAKIVVKNNYEKRGDLVLRSYIRALRKINEERLLDGENALIYGIIDDENKFHELFTDEIIDHDDYILVDIEEIFDAATVPNNRKELLRKLMSMVLFGNKEDLGIEISSIEELAKDRAVEFEAYNNYLSRINPYMRLDENDSQELYNRYNDFSHKLKEAKAIKKVNVEIQNYDDYEVRSYQPRPKVYRKK